LAFANYQSVQIFCQHVTEFLASSNKDWDAEIYLLKTEYMDSRKLQAQRIQTINASKVGQEGYQAIVTKANIALIDTAIGADSKTILDNLDNCRRYIKGLHGIQQRGLSLLLDQRLADLFLRDGDHTAANILLAQTFAAAQFIDKEQALICLERLADLSTGMGSIETTLGCFMDIHRWRADCMVHIADIFEHQGEVVKSVRLWKAARPLFEKSSQAKDMTRINVKLAAVELQLSRLANSQQTEGELVKVAPGSGD
ncbi:hypothetical protein C8J57DRAFT_1318941, partial [Mycena rebaudengoi]